ncbi:MAG TPA: OmpA family protein [Burkholderiaceae bacterium]|nr:OmpA family protein [Burkholderiaceae bacterium]
MQLPGTSPTPGGTPGAPPTEIPRASSGLTPNLEAQRVRLKDLLKGTPVNVEASSEGTLLVDVPLKYAFDPGRTAVKAPLGAVLDQVVVGLKPYASCELRVLGPGDSRGADAALAKARADSVRTYLVARGVAPGRFTSPSTGHDDTSLELVISERAASSSSR